MQAAVTECRIYMRILDRHCAWETFASAYYYYPERDFRRDTSDLKV